MFIVDKAATANLNNTLPTPKIIFFDIDDTLSRNGIIAEHNKATLEQLAEQLHTVLCSFFLSSK